MNKKPSYLNFNKSAYPWKADINYPKFCTCAQMRRHYPGHSSYSLASLCYTYDINLTQHHRALCDAKAAAKLLKYINQSRCIGK
jgi:DNA polymerase-3 subunit epsilon